MSTRTYWCYNCRRSTTPTESLACSTCSSSFIEETEAPLSPSTQDDLPNADNLIYLLNVLQRANNLLGRRGTGGEPSALATLLQHLGSSDAESDDEEEDVLNDLFLSSGVHGAPPASKKVVDNLKRQTLTEDSPDLEKECAVCKDEFIKENQVVELPCEHLFHKDCILPWLESNNSCPVCRLEMPTDDPEYEAQRVKRVTNTTSISKQLD
eukprot:TRINITY_DN13422_c0_g1_i1.p1 TRINITY_DN13422_c0_g1~~TRINITY_DN13422_c0_g1_i1.p1  ORF type:complete len:210 (+),score=27.38 TRINITY_DN13422_c0_g1_i1:154-783(+)